jgi:solute carrier family 25 carnitine/acylcarnitine transporter 20/29
MSEQPSGGGYKDFIAGTVGGWAQVIAGQPFDIVKVRMASATSQVSVTEVASQIIQREGPLSFWKGSLPPLMGVGACVSIQFGVVETVKRLQLDANEGKELTIKQIALCGSVAGFVNSFVAAPVEGFRIRMQVQGRVDPRGDLHYRSDIDCIKKVYRHHGLAGCYRGLGITMIRESCCFSTYFSTYEYLIGLMRPPGGTVADCSIWQLLLAGGCSGVMYWVPWYHIDAVKSKVQADSLTNPRYASALDCISLTMKTDGIRGFYRGFVPCLLRAFPANSATFLGYEMTMRMIGRD